MQLFSMILRGHVSSPRCSTIPRQVAGPTGGEEAEERALSSCFLGKEDCFCFHLIGTWPHLAARYRSMEGVAGSVLESIHPTQMSSLSMKGTEHEYWKRIRPSTPLQCERFSINYKSVHPHDDTGRHYFHLEEKGEIKLQIINYSKVLQLELGVERKSTICQEQLFTCVVMYQLCDCGQVMMSLSFKSLPAKDSENSYLQICPEYRITSVPNSTQKREVITVTVMALMVAATAQK